MAIYQFEYHTFLHHSQTYGRSKYGVESLSTIHFYIILKQTTLSFVLLIRLSTIHFYIILKRCRCYQRPVSGLSTIHFYIILKPQI